MTSYAEIVLTSPADDFAHPAFGKLFVETEYLPDSAALLCHRRAGTRDGCRRVGRCTSAEPRGPPPGTRRMGDRSRALPRPGAAPQDPVALDGRALSGTTGVVLDPIVSLRQRIRLSPGATVRLSFATGMAADRETAEALARKYRDPSAAVAHLRAGVSRTLRAACVIWASPPTRPCCSNVWRRACSARIGRLRASADTIAANELGQAGCGPTLFPAICRSCSSGSSAMTTSPLVRQVLQAQEYWRLKGLSADVVILNEHPVSYLDEMQAQLTALLDDGPWSTWQHRPGGAYLLRGDRMGRPSGARGSRRARGPAGTAGICERNSHGPKAFRRPRRLR